MHIYIEYALSVPQIIMYIFFKTFLADNINEIVKNNLSVVKESTLSCILTHFKKKYTL